MSALRIAEPVGPAPAADDKRQSKRMQFYRGEFPDAFIAYGGKDYEADVYDLSTAGVSLLPRREIPGLDTLRQSLTVRFGDTAPRRAVLENINFVKFSGAIRLKLGLSLAEAPAAPATQLAKYPCKDSMPMAYCDDPIAFNRTILFNVSYFSATGLGLKTRAEDGALYPGLRLDLRLMMPVRGEFRVVAEVQSVAADGGGLEAHCAFGNASDALRSSIAEFLLITVPGLTIKELKARGFLVADLEKAFLFRCAQTPAQADGILGLRLKAAQADGRWQGETDVGKMRDDWDKHARQIYCEINSQIVASARIVFNNGLAERSEHLSYGVDIPDWLWDAGFVECSRVCTDPDFRGSDVFFHVIQNISRIVTQSGYRYILLNCVDGLVPVYKKTAGVFSLKQRFHTPFMQDRALNLLCIDIRAVQIGVNLMPKTWIINAPVGSYLMSMGKLKLRPWERALRFAFGGAHRVMLALHRRQARRKAKQEPRPRR